MGKITKEPAISSTLQTRHDEKIFTTSDLNKAKGYFTTNRVLRKWSEDFVDEDTNEVVTIERNEIILDRAVLLDTEALALLNFYFQSGDITEIEVSNQRRGGLFNSYLTSIWQVTAVILGKKKNIYLYADSVYTAIEIAKDYVEQNYDGGFGFVQIKYFDSVILITDNYDEDEDESDEFEEPKEPETYRIELEVDHEDAKHNTEFIVNARDAEKAKVLIERFLAVKFAKENREPEFITTLISAKVIPCEAMIDLDFCNKYLETAQ